VRRRFEETDRFARGRIVAALAAGEELPRGLGEARTERALAGLLRDGLVVADADGHRLP
jgi:A/G-specific adenine glycosylase